MMYDAIILGKGPAGVSASVYLARSGFSVLVVGKEIGALERAEHIENYYGFPGAGERYGTCCAGCRAGGTVWVLP